jgi:hypothetical protein
MKAIDFMPGQTIPLAQDQDEYYTLPVIKVKYSDGTEAFVSAWKGSLIERLLILFGAPIYLGVLTRAQHPPVHITLDGDEFNLDDVRKEKK